MTFQERLAIRSHSGILPPMKHSFLGRWAGGWLALTGVVALGAETPLRKLLPAPAPDRATIRVRADRPAPQRVPRFITGKFAEHLWWNIYNGMDARVLRNPTFAEYPFRAGPMSPDGMAQFYWQTDRIDAELRRQARRYGWPEAALDGLVRARRDGLACFWTRVGPADAVVVSPDTGPAGGRAQRVQIAAAGQGVAQWTWLPLHRVRRFEVEICARAPEPMTLVAELAGESGATAASARWELPEIGPEWRAYRGTLEAPADWPADGRFQFRLTGAGPGEWVVRHVLLRPTDHVAGADPDIVARLRASRLPLLRWPGGNFVSAYHWEDGVGPLERRPARPNPAWGGVEPNLFGTHEFIAFCRAVGCEPMICLNAGDGTPAEAARWVEYCNGGTNTPMGALRAANGHPEPFHVRHWEIGNELWGRWQFHWTTPSGYVDRYRQFVAALRAVDPSLTLYACGAPVFKDGKWNRTLIEELGPELVTLTDHPLIGGPVPADTAPGKVYRDFMAVPEVLQQRWTALREMMRRNGGREPRLAVTELQVFAKVAPPRDPNAPRRLRAGTFPGQASITEAVYDVLVYHAALRLAPFVSLITHSAVVNHGGGLRKERERVYANPCYYARSLFAAFGGARILPVEIAAARDEAPRVLPDLRRAAPAVEFAVVDAFAARNAAGDVLVSLAQRRPDRPVRVRVELAGWPAGRSVRLDLLAGDHPGAANTLDAPETVTPRTRMLTGEAGAVEFELPPCSVARLIFPAGK